MEKHVELKQVIEQTLSEPGHEVHYPNDVNLELAPDGRTILATYMDANGGQRTEHIDHEGHTYLGHPHQNTNSEKWPGYRIRSNKLREVRQLLLRYKNELRQP